MENFELSEKAQKLTKLTFQKKLTTKSLFSHYYMII